MVTVALIEGELTFMMLIDAIIDCTNNYDATEVHIKFKDGGEDIKLVGQKLLVAKTFINVADDSIIDGSKIKDLLDGTDDVKNLILQSEDEGKYRKWYLSAV